MNKIDYNELIKYWENIVENKRGCLKVMGSNSGVLEDINSIDKTIKILKQDKEQSEKFDVLEHFRNGKKLKLGDTCYVLQYDDYGNIEVTDINTQCVCDVPDIYKMLLDHIIEGAVEPYEESKIEDMLEDGQWYWVDYERSNSSIVTRVMYRQECMWLNYHGGDIIPNKYIKPKLKNGKLIKCVKNE